MRISLDWLRQYATLDAPVGTLVAALVDTGTEVDRVERIPQGVVVCRVTALEPVPESTKGVQFADLDTGGDPVRVLTGAANLSVGDLVPWAPVGVTLPGWDQPLGARVMFRKYSSPGMLCSEVELGLGDDAAGILVLDRGIPGQPLQEVLPLDVALEVEPTTNRPDSLCHVGIARELAAALGETLREPDTEVPAAHESAVPVEGRLEVRIEDPQGCLRFTARVIDDVVVGPSPPWLRRRLEAVGLPVINNVVDVTNFVAAELGQPLHAFDLDHFVEAGRAGAAPGATARAAVVVRSARPGERVACLDGVERELDGADLVVCSAGTPVSVGGIIGGSSTAVQSSTRRVLLEAASWDGARIRASSRRLGRRTEASALYEKGLSDTVPPLALDRAAELIAEISGGHILRGRVDAEGTRQPPIPAIEVAVSRISALLGYDVDTDDAGLMLVRLGFGVEQQGDRLRVSPPHFRRDVLIAEDVVEEVGRGLGYARVPATLPGRRSSLTQLAPALPLDDRVRDLCVGAGFDEAISYSFTAPEQSALLGGLGSGRRPIPVSNPLSEEWSVLRVGLLPGLCAAVAANLNRGVREASLFEVGRAYWEGARQGMPAGCTPDGRDATAIPLPGEPLLLGIASHRPGGAAEAATELRHLQSLLARLVLELTGAELEVTPIEADGLHPGRSAAIHLEGRPVGLVGELAPATAAAFGLRGRCVVAELHLDALASGRPRLPRYRTPSRLPAVVQDLAVTVPPDQPAGPALQTIREAGGRLLEDVELYDEYRGDALGGRKGWTFRLTYRSPDHTLTGAEAQAAQDTIATALKVRCQAEIRR
ncbi:MAG: phenylalanine--tRNA ligase subunit beta [Candidatus Dormibacteria bacterium]